MGLASGFSIPVAQYFGAGDYDKMRKSVANAMKLSGFVAALLTLLSLVFLKQILILLQTNKILMSDSLSYGYIIFAGLTATVAYNFLSCMLRAVGDSRTPFFAVAVATVINIVFDCIFIFGFKTGVWGAAIATVLAQLSSAAICYIRIRKIEIMHLKKSDFYDGKSYRTVLIKNGIPMALMNSITGVGIMVVQYFVNGMGVAATSAFSACSKYANLFMQPGNTAANTVSAYTSQNFGAREYGRIRKGIHVSLGLVSAFYVVIASLMVFGAETLAKIMLHEENTIKLATVYLPIEGVCFIILYFLFVIRAGCQGMGYPLFPMISGGMEMIMRIVFIILLTGSMGFAATAWADVSAWCGALVVNFIAYEIILNLHIKKTNRIAVPKTA